MNRWCWFLLRHADAWLPVNDLDLFYWQPMEKAMGPILFLRVTPVTDGYLIEGRG